MLFCAGLLYEKKSLVSIINSILRVFLPERFFMKTVKSSLPKYMSFPENFFPSSVHEKNEKDKKERFGESGFDNLFVASMAQVISFLCRFLKFEIRFIKLSFKVQFDVVADNVVVEAGVVNKNGDSSSSEDPTHSSTQVPKEFTLESTESDNADNSKYIFLI
jgi:hypothetical protein